MAVAGQNTVAADRLKSFVERIENVSGEIDALGEDRKEIFSEAKSAGFDTKVLRKLIALRKVSEQERREQADTLDMYMQALGMFA